MMIGIADQFSFTQLLIGLALLFIAQMVFFRYMMGRLNSDPADSPEGTVGDRESEILGDQPLRSTVGTPRLRRLQPSPRTTVSAASPESSAGAEKATDVVPVEKISTDKVDLPAEKAVDPYAPLPMAASEEPALLSEEAVPLPALNTPPKQEPAPEKPLSMAVAETGKPEPLAAAPAPVLASSAEPPDTKAPVEKIPLPPLATETPASTVQPMAAVPVPVIPATSLVQIPETTPDALPTGGGNMPPESKKEEPSPKPAPASPAPADVVPVSAIPRRLFVNPFAKATVPEEGKAEEAPAPASAAPAVEPVGAGIVAVSGPASLEAPAEPFAATDAEESDDVKKRKTPKTPKAEPERAGLVLIPPVTASEVAKPSAGPVPVEAKAEPPVGALTLVPTAPEARKEPAPAAQVQPVTKLVGRPRIFLPTNVPAATVPKEEPAAVKPAPEPAVPAGIVEEKAAPAPEPSPAVIQEPEVVPVPEIKPEPKPEPVAEVEPAAKVEPEMVPAITEAKVEPEPAKEAEAPKAEEKPAVTEEKPEPKPSVEETKSEEKPVESEPLVAVVPAPESEPKPAEPAAVVPPPIPEPVEPVAAIPLAAEPPSVSAPAPDAAEPAVVPTPSLEAAKTEEKLPEPEAPAPPPVPLLPKTETEPAAAPHVASFAPANPITTSEPVMPPTENTTSTSATGRASAQLTLGFEITSLQLTPFFKLGAVQLRPLSNVVSLHLIGAQPENPLAAGISFQIDRVELDGSKIKAILLKLLGGAQAAATPQPKLQVNAVELSQAAEGAPISITPSDQTSTAVQLLATFTIAAMDFTPSFEIGSLRLEPTSNQVMLRLAPSSRPAALDLPPSFDVSTVQLGGDAQIAAVALTPSAPKAA